MLKIPRGAAYLVLIALLAAAVYMVTAAGGIEGLLSAANWRAAEESPGADEDTVEASDDPADWDLDTDRQYFIEYRLERERARARRRDVEDRIASALWRCVDEAMDAREDFAIALDESGGPVIPARTRSLRAPLSLGDIQEREVVLIYMGSGDDL